MSNNLLKPPGHGRVAKGAWERFKRAHFLAGEPDIDYKTAEGLSADEVLTGAARALWVTAWSDEMEERGQHFPGQDLMDVAPPTPKAAKQMANLLLSRIAHENHASIQALLHTAWSVDDQWRVDNTPGTIEYARLFGHYLAMQALGHGVSWFDDHDRFPLKVPSVENYALRDLVR